MIEVIIIHMNQDVDQVVKQFCGTKQYNYVKHKRFYVEEKLNLVMKST